MDKPKVILVGYGYWGINLLRNLVSCGRFDVVGVIEPNQNNVEKCQAAYPHIKVFSQLAIGLEEVKPDAAVIATPPKTHCDLAVECIERGCHVLIEKPMATSADECNKILSAAHKANKQVMVDHTFVYHPAVTYLAEKVHGGDLGDLLYFDSSRVNLGGIQMTNVLWDLAPHDLSILDYLLKGECPTSVNAMGQKHYGSPVETMCYANMAYSNSFMGHFHLNWTSPVKVRQVMLVGTKKMAIYDDNVPTEKIRLYDKGVNIDPTSRDLKINYRVGEMVAPVVLQVEALKLMVNEFADAIVHGKTPKTDGYAGARVVKILEALSKSMAQNGQPVKIDPLEIVAA